jgi:putative glycosyltransferase (TIGR04372 family)
MTDEPYVMSWKRYISPAFLVGKFHKKGLAWCVKLAVVVLGCYAKRLALMFLVAPAILPLRLLSPFLRVRFGHLLSDRIGHFALNTELYLCERDTGMHRRTFDIFYLVPPISNNYLTALWKRKLHISPAARWLDHANRRFPCAEILHALLPSDRDVHNLLSRTKPHLALTAQEEQMGWTAMRNLGVSEGAPFVCLHSRDRTYLDKVFPGENWHYHDYHNSEIENFLQAAEELACRGYFVVRTGACVRKPLNTKNPSIIDYATKGRTEFLDVFLGANCKFYLGDSCGYNAIPSIFRRPVATVNMLPLERASTWAEQDIFITKKHWLCAEHRFMTFEEIFKSGAGRFLRSEQFEKMDIELIDNTPEEIAALGIEMDERLKGTWKTTDEDEELQRRFWAIFPKSELHGEFRSRIGADFLRRNQDLLGPKRA